MKELILATSNPGKIHELQAILSPIHCIPQNSLGIESADEIGLSFIENAMPIKEGVAASYCQLHSPGLRQYSCCH